VKELGEALALIVPFTLAVGVVIAVVTCFIVMLIDFASRDETRPDPGDEDERT